AGCATDSAVDRQPFRKFSGFSVNHSDFVRVLKRNVTGYHLFVPPAPGLEAATRLRQVSLARDDTCKDALARILVRARSSLQPDMAARNGDDGISFPGAVQKPGAAR